MVVGSIETEHSASEYLAKIIGWREVFQIKPFLSPYTTDRYKKERNIERIQAWKESSKITVTMDNPMDSFTMNAWEVK